MKYRIIESWTVHRGRVFEVEASDKEMALCLWDAGDAHVELVDEFDQAMFLDAPDYEVQIDELQLVPELSEIDAEEFNAQVKASLSRLKAMQEEESKTKEAR